MEPRVIPLQRADSIANVKAGGPELLVLHVNFLKLKYFDPIKCQKGLVKMVY